MVIYKKINIVVITVFAVFLLSFAPAFVEAGTGGVDERPYKFIQGFVSEESAGGFTVNEHLKVFYFPDTKVLSSSGKELAQNSLKGHKWVYLEGPLNKAGYVEAEYIYLMPRYIKIDEREKYPFIKTP